jgi:hypothetical protein
LESKINILNLLANVKLNGVMQKSAEIAHSLSELMKVEQFQSISEQFSKELTKVRIFILDL